MDESLHTQARLKAALEEGGEVRSLGTVLGGYEILCAVRGGDRQPSIVVTAGAHADELGGVYAALRMAECLDTPHQTFIIPVRDPFGFHGFRRAVQFCVGRPVRIEGPDDVVRVLKSEGELLHEDGSFLLVKTGPFAIAFDVGTDFPTSSVGRNIEPLLKSRPELVPILAGCQRVISPYNLPMPRYGDVYDQACRSMKVTPDGFVGNMNRFFGEKEQPEEVAILQKFTETVRPALVLDLHEGYGRGFYIYVSEDRTPFMDQIADSMVAAVKAHGGATATVEELTPYWGPIAEGRTMVSDGLLYVGADDGVLIRHILGEEGRRLLHAGDGRPQPAVVARRPAGVVRAGGN